MARSNGIKWLAAGLVGLGLGLGWQAIGTAQDAKKPVKKVGYDDTPVLPNSKWKVHDKERPAPRVITPGTASTADQAGKAPSDAIVLFDGTDTSKWKGGKWKVENGYMEINKTGNLVSKEEFGDCHYHLEWASPAQVKGESQGRGNSGVIIMGRYEIQVLDSYDNATYADGGAGSIYGQFPPLVNASRKPGEWQTYDIIFKAPRFEDGKLTQPAYVTVIHNGVVVHHHKELIGAVSHRGVGKYSPHPPKGSLTLQDHGDAVRYRNIWVRPLGEYDQE